MKIHQEKPNEDGWTDWIAPKQGYLMQCCDCDLIHKCEFRVVKLKGKQKSKYLIGEDLDTKKYRIVFRVRRYEK